MLTIFNNFNLVKFIPNTIAIKGKTLKNNIETSCVVRCYDRITGEMVSSTISDVNGNFILFGSRENKNYVLAVDSEEKYNIVVQDMISG